VAYKRLKVGSVLKSKDASQPDYIKVDADVSLKKGDILNLESKKSKLASLEKNIENGKLSGDLADKIREGIEKMPDFVRFEIIKVTKD
jgi:uncharacterized Zn finger protein